jgi:hypothetical protein
LFSCKEKKEYLFAEDALDAGREFIDGCLKGDFAKAKFYMLPDSKNLEHLEKLKDDYNEQSKEDKEQYKQASIIIQNEETITDGVHIIYYKNSFDKIARKVKVIQQHNNWQVDLKYTFDGNL